MASEYRRQKRKSDVKALLQNILRRSAAGLLSALKWIIVVEAKVITVLALVAITTWFGWDYFMRTQTDEHFRRIIPSNFVLKETIHITWSMTCGVGIYSLSSLDLDSTRTRGTAFTEIMSGKPFNELLDGVQNARSIGNVVLDGKYCIYDSEHRDPMMDTMYSSDAYFSYRPKGGHVVAYNASTNRLYVMSGGN